MENNNVLSLSVSLSVGSSGTNGDPSYDGILSDVYRRPLSESELMYLRSRYPTLAIANDDVSSYLYQLPKVFKIKESNWRILDYFHQFICAPFQSRGDHDGEGTLEAQGLITVRALLLEAKKRGWTSLRIMEGGTDRLARYAWILGEESGMVVNGYSPTPRAQVIAARHAHLNAFNSVKELRSANITPGSRFGSSSGGASNGSSAPDDMDE